METNNLNNFTKGWFIGDFEPSLNRTKDFEVSVKHYNKGDFESRHYHNVAKEITLVVSGKIKMNNVVYKKNDIIIIEPGESTDFKSITKSTTVVIKTPSTPNDKFIIDERET